VAGLDARRGGGHVGDGDDRRAPVAAAASAPNARFDVAVAGTVATFTDTSTGEPATWAWDFGDGATSTDQNPTHTYAPGKYTVTLTVTNDAGSDHTSHGVTIKEPPPDRTYSRNLYSGLVRYQNPDMTSCVAASTLIMLNEVATTGRQGDGFAWTTSVALGRQRAREGPAAPPPRRDVLVSRAAQ